MNILVILIAIFTPHQSTDEEMIRAVMARQQADWNVGNLEAFMDGYWKSDSLRFISSRGVQYGWQATLDGYKRGYPTKEKMGELTFTLLSVDVVSPTAAVVIGKWSLKRAQDEPNGHFMLLWRKINGRWVIIADHTS